MESSLGLDQSLIHELSQGRELARQLQIHLNVSSSSREARELLVQKILNSYDKALTMLKLNGPHSMAEQQLNTEVVIGRSDSPLSYNGSPQSEDTHRDFNDMEIRNEPKKRKSMSRWTQQVQVCPGTGLEGPLDDGYTWRKYGQKDILGAKYPRSYYRCTHRNLQGCLATKQVQRSDEDPSLFQITNRGKHTCIKGFQLDQTTPQLSPPEQKLEPDTMLAYQPQTTESQHNQTQSQEILLSFKTGLKVMTEDSQTQSQNFSTSYNFDFPSTSHIMRNSTFVSTPINEKNISGNYFSSPVISPATSMSDYYSLPPSQVAGFEKARNMQDSELMDIVSMATSANNSPSLGLDFPFGPMDPFDASFSFNDHSLFSNFQ